MKAIILFGFALLPLVTSAQFERGQLFVGGSLAGSSVATNYTGYTKEVTTSLTLLPSIGFFLNSKVALGIGLGYTASWDSFNEPISPLNNTSEHASSFNINSFVRRYIPITNSFYIALQGQVSFMRTSPVYSQLESYSVGANVSPIFIFFPSRKWGIEAGVGSLGYTYNRTLPNIASTNTFSFSSGTFSLGLAYYFGKKSK
jgi:hypothetical protein